MNLCARGGCIPLGGRFESLAGGVRVALCRTSWLEIMETIFFISPQMSNWRLDSEAVQGCSMFELG